MFMLKWEGQLADLKISNMFKPAQLAEQDHSITGSKLILSGISHPVSGYSLTSIHPNWCLNVLIL